MFYPPEEIDEAQARVNEEKEKFDNSLDEEHRNKIKAIGEAFKLFSEANLPVFLFAEHEAISSNGEKVMLQYNNLREISLSREGDIEIPRLTKKFAKSIYNFICAFIFPFLRQKGIGVPVSFLPAVYFDLYNNLDTKDLSSLKKSEEEFYKKMKEQTNASKN